MRRSKYNNRHVRLYGHTFDSQAEANRYLVLRDMQEHGEIEALGVHTPFVLLDAFDDAWGNHHRAIRYEADFAYRERGQYVVEDVKGHKTAVYRIKRKLFAWRYPGVEFREVKA